jgi:hypothetical protein
LTSLRVPDRQELGWWHFRPDSFSLIPNEVRAYLKMVNLRELVEAFNIVDYKLFIVSGKLLKLCATNLLGPWYSGVNQNMHVLWEIIL